MNSLSRYTIPVLILLLSGVHLYGQSDAVGDDGQASGTVSIGMQYLLAEGVKPPTIKPDAPAIEYPEPALIKKLSGSVEVEVNVDAEGKIAETKLKRSTDSLFSKAVLDGLSKFEFTPAKDGDKPVPISVILEIRFKIQNTWTTAYSERGEEGEEGSDPESWAYVADATLPKVDKKKLYENLVYPPEAKASLLNTTIPVRALVGADGVVKDVEVQGTPDSLLAAAAVEAVRKTPFFPGIEGGAPTEMWALVPVQFSLHGKVRDDSDLEGKPEATRGVTKPTYDFAELQSNFHIQGGLTEPVEVAMRVLIDEKGNVVQVDVENDAQYSVVSAAVEAVKKTHFEPGTQNGDPIAVWTTITIKASPKKSSETGE